MYRLRILGAGLCLALAGTLSPVAAQPTSADSDRMREAIGRVADGTWSRADLRLLKTDPEVAAQVPDPRPRGEEWGSSSGQADVAARTAAARRLGSCGHWYYAWFRKRSLLGRTMYRYFHRVDYCKTQRRITEWENREDYWRDVTGVAYWRELTRNSRSDLPKRRKARSSRQRHIELCVVKYGCYANLYPTVTLVIRANGNNTYRGDAG